MLSQYVLETLLAGLDVEGSRIGVGVGTVLPLTRRRLLAIKCTPLALLEHEFHWDLHDTSTRTNPTVWFHQYVRAFPYSQLYCSDLVVFQMDWREKLFTRWLLEEDRHHHGQRGYHCVGKLTITDGDSDEVLHSYSQAPQEFWVDTFPSLKALELHHITRRLPVVITILKNILLSFSYTRPNFEVIFSNIRHAEVGMVFLKCIQEELCQCGDNDDTCPLRSITMTNCCPELVCMTPSWLTSTSAAMTCQRLRSLRIITPNGTVKFANSLLAASNGYFSNLREIALCHVKVDEVNDLDDFPHDLTKLTLQQCELTTNGCTKILSTLTCLEFLELSGNSSACIDVANVAPHTSLQSLILQEQMTTIQQSYQFCVAVESLFPALTTIDLTRNTMTSNDDNGETMVGLVKLFGHPMLKHVTLSRVAVYRPRIRSRMMETWCGDELVRVIAGHPALCTVDLSSNPGMGDLFCELIGRSYSLWSKWRREETSSLGSDDARKRAKTEPLPSSYSSSSSLFPSFDISDTDVTKSGIVSLCTALIYNNDSPTMTEDEILFEPTSLELEEGYWFDAAVHQMECLSIRHVHSEVSRHTVDAVNKKLRRRVVRYPILTPSIHAQHDIDP
eukprot:PhF_6_TR44436/c0_g1_i1/m.68398